MEFLLVWLLFGIASAVVASNKGKEGCAWFILGCLLGPFGLILALVSKPDQRRLDNQAISTGLSQKCPECAELVRAEARKCRFCGAELHSDATQPAIAGRPHVLEGITDDSEDDTNLHNPAPSAEQDILQKKMDDPSTLAAISILLFILVISWMLFF